MIIDSHQHFWTYHPSTHPWINTSMDILKRDFMPEHLKTILLENGISGCVAVQTDQSESETTFLLDCAKQHAFIKAVVGWLDLRAEDFETKLQQFTKDSNLKGLRHIVQDEPSTNFMLRPDFQKGIGLLEKYNLTYDILIYPKQLPTALELVKTFSTQTFVLDHMAKPDCNGPMDAEWRHFMLQLGKCDNVFCKVSGLVTEAMWGKWSKLDFEPFLDVAFKAFGPERILYGSDWPVCLLSANYSEVLEIVISYLTRFSMEDQKRVLGLNAVSFYNIKI